MTKKPSRKRLARNKLEERLNPEGFRQELINCDLQPLLVEMYVKQYEAGAERIYSILNIKTEIK